MYTKNNYYKFLKQLNQEKEEEYKQFHQKLLKNNKIKLIGVRTPKLKKIAKEISKQDYQNFIKLNTHNTYEETIVHGFVLGYLKINETELLKLINEFLPYIDNWATNDLVASNLKQFKNIDIDHINIYINSKNPWTIRFGLTLLLNHYIVKDNLKTIFHISNNIKNTNYYVQMANAWLISTCYTKYPIETEKYLKNNNLDTFTFNKTISKICDSYKVSKEKKKYLKTLKRK